MNALSSVAVLICCVSGAAAMLSLFIPQKRTRKILSFVLGLFILVEVGNGIRNATVDLPAIKIQADTYTPDSYDDEYEKAIIRSTADRLVLSLNTILTEEDIHVQDIRLSLKKSEDNSITVDRVVIYINDDDSDRAEEIKSIVYRNLSKEPEVYVTTYETR